MNDIQEIVRLNHKLVHWESTREKFKNEAITAIAGIYLNPAEEEFFHEHYHYFLQNHSGVNCAQAL
jgi:hypothetical protein